MDSQYVCHLCDISFTRNSDLKRHMKSKHGRDTKQGHRCGECGKGFSRKDILKRHQLTCQSIRFKCPRCHRIFKDIVSLTQHMGLCPVPTCHTCQEQFVELDQLREHQKSNRKRKTTSDPLAPKLKKRKRDGWFHCRVCLDSFATREELFHHRLDHMDDDRAYRPMEPHFDFEDEKLNALLRDNAKLIFSHHRFTQVSANFNFPLTLSLTRDGWLNDIYQTLDLVANISNDESFKFNLSMGFILVNRESGDYRFFVPHANNAFFKTPQRIEPPACWRELYSQLDEEALKAYVTHHRENTKWLPLMITNVVVHLYYLGIPMGSGLLPDYVTNHGSIVGLDKEEHNRTPYKDKHCGVRCLAFHLNYKQTGNGFRGLEERRQQLSVRWNRVVNLTEVPRFEETFDIDVDIYTLCPDGAVIPRYLSEERHADKMVLNLHDTHLSYVKNVPAYLKKYRCGSCGRNFVKLDHLKRHQGSCANATEYEFAGGFHKMSPSIFDRLEEFDIVVPEENRLYPWFIVYDFEAILAPITEEQWERSCEKLTRLLGSLHHYCRQIPVLGFNSAKYDLNLVKSHLIPWLRRDVDPNKDDEDTCDVNVIKKGSTYTQIGARRFKFLDISNYLAGGVSYSASSKPTKFPKPNLIFLTNGSIIPPNWIFPVCLHTKPFIRSWNRGMCSKWETKKKTMTMTIKTRTTKCLVHDYIENCKTFGNIEAWLHFVISWSITTIWTSALSFKRWKKCKNSISITTSTCSRWPCPFQVSPDDGYSRRHTMPKSASVWFSLKTTIFTTPSNRTSSVVRASYSPETPRWVALSFGTSPATPAPISSDSMPMPYISTASTKPCRAVDMCAESLRTSSRTLDSLVRTCFIGWIISWKRKAFISSMHATTSAKSVSGPIWWTVTIPTPERSMNSTDAIFTAVPTAKKIKTT